MAADADTIENSGSLGWIGFGRRSAFSMRAQDKARHTDGQQQSDKKSHGV
jgi:hypothetical protein